MTRTSISPDNNTLHELRDDLKDLSKSLKESSEVSKKFTLVLFTLSIIQVLIAVFQLIISFAYSTDTRVEVLGSTMVIFTIIILSYLSHKVLYIKRIKT